MDESPRNHRPLYVDQNQCLGCQSCVTRVPRVFRVTTEGLSEVYNPHGDTEEKIKGAIENCPVYSIHWQDEHLQKPG